MSLESSAIFDDLRWKGCINIKINNLRITVEEEKNKMISGSAELFVSPTKPFIAFQLRKRSTRTPF